MKATDSSHIAEVHPDEEGTPDHVAVGHETPKAAVLAVIPIVAHDEVTFGRDGTGHAARTVDACIPICMLHCGMSVRPLTLAKDSPMVDVAKRLHELLVGLDPPGVEVPFDLPHRNHGAVDRQASIVIVDLVPGKPDYPLNVILARLVGIAEHDDVAAPGVPEFEHGAIQ